MNQLTRNGPNPTIDRLQREASEAWENLEYQKGIHLIERAARKEPGNPSLLLNLAQAYAQRYDFAAAERYIEKAGETFLGSHPDPRKSRTNVFGVGIR